MTAFLKGMWTTEVADHAAESKMKINMIISFHAEHLLPALPVHRRHPMLAQTSLDESCRGVNNLVGSDIRALRKSRGLTITDLTSALGRSVGWLSQVERGHTVPSVRDLAAIAAYFDVSLNFFFRSAHQNPEEQGLVLRAADRMAIGSSETGLSEELLSPTLGGSFEMIMSTFAPGSDSGGPKATRPTEDGGVLISGQLTMWIGALKVVLHPGDSFQFRKSTYAWQNEGTEPAVVIWVISPPVY